VCDTISDTQFVFESSETMLVGTRPDDDQTGVRQRREDVGQCADSVLVTLVSLQSADGDDEIARLAIRWPRYPGVCAVRNEPDPTRRQSKAAAEQRSFEARHGHE
jgi:hypothetical protein